MNMGQEYEDEGVDEIRKRQIMDARDRAMDARARNVSSAFGGTDRKQRLIAYREMIEQYILQVESIWRQDPVFDEYWKDDGEPIGDVVARPPEPTYLIETQSVNYPNNHPPIVAGNLDDAQHVGTIHSVRQLVNAPKQFTAEWWVEVNPRHGARKRYETTTSTVVAADVLDRCLRVTNHTAAELGLDLTVSPGDIDATPV